MKFWCSLKIGICLISFLLTFRRFLMLFSSAQCVFTCDLKKQNKCWSPFHKKRIKTVAVDVRVATCRSEMFSSVSRYELITSRLLVAILGKCCPCDCELKVFK
jgi:hypothetical protein